MILTTTNITEAIDVAFLDRADIKVRAFIRRGEGEGVVLGVVEGLGP